MMEHLKVSGMYWGLTALALVDRLDTLSQVEVIEFVKKCQNKDGTDTDFPPYTKCWLHLTRH